MTTQDHDPTVSTAAPTLKRTPLYAEHVALGGRMVEFGGWEMPVQYSGIVDEHRAVRTAAGLFDVSHMGEFAVEGPGALAFLQSLVPNNVAKVAENQALYSQICLETGGTVDDLLIYHLGPERYLVVVNAGTLENDWQWFTQHAQGHEGIILENRSSAIALIALQGPRAQEILSQLTTADLANIVYYHCTSGQVAGIDCIISRTGYTGEDGFELYHPAEDAVTLWRALLAAGAPAGIRPAGLGARDTLRLEAGLCLYGHELTEAITPLEADLGWSVKLKKGTDFIGREALAAQKANGVPRVRVGLAIRDRAVARADSPIWHDDQQVGTLTSGTMSISLGHPIGMGYVPPALATPGTQLHVEVRGKRIPAEVVPMPFYKRPE
jgi:aminomethyltransferase